MKLSLRLALAIGTVSVVAIIIIFLIIDILARSAIEDSIIQRTYSEMSVYATSLDSWFRENMIAVDSLAVALMPFDRNIQQDILVSFYEEFDFIEVTYIGFIDDGVILSSDFWIPDDDYVVQDQDWFMAAIAAGGETIFTAPYIDEGLIDALIVSLVRYVPTIGAVVGLDIYLEQISMALANLYVPGDGYLMLVDYDGYIVYHPSPSLAPTDDGLVHISTTPYVYFMSQVELASTFIDIDGTSSYIMTYDLSSANWTLFAIFPDTVISEPVGQMLIVFRLLFIVLLSIIYVAMLYLVSKLIRATIHSKIASFRQTSEALANGTSTSTNNLGDNSYGFDVLDHEFAQVVDSISNVYDDIDNLYREHGLGNYTYLPNTARHDGIYRGILVKINDLVAKSNDKREAILKYFQELADGNFKAECEQQFVGKETFINDILATVRQNILDVTDSIADITRAAQSGDVDYSVDSTEYRGEWAEIINEMNSIIATINAPITEMRNVLARFNEGHFDKQVEGNYSGIFAEIKHDVNRLVDEMGKYVREISTSLGAISDGNLTHRSSMTFKGKFDEIGTSINNIAETLQQTMSEIAAAAEQVLAGAAMVSTSSANLADGATDQAHSVSELNITLEKINEQTAKNSQNASEANVISNESVENAQVGNISMKQMLEAMLQIKESSNNISRITKVIQDIAFQTNLLSLNASVEAARAGDHGKGFAVVAEEVRTLASRSQQAATETSELIEDSLNRVDMGNSIAEATSDALDGIVTSASNVLQIINNISLSSQEQTDAVNQINVGLSKISAVVQNNQALSEESAATAHELNSQAELLDRLVSYFKL
ncbi:MAG: methyl-accepting chemotaxis protein [Turicibacter sp.]|nr:methyl-accepting chemotaxis protein [Turicibacter sp.]